MGRPFQLFARSRDISDLLPNLFHSKCGYSAASPKTTNTFSSSDAAIRKYFSNMEWLSIEKGTLINCDPYELDVFFSVQREIYLKKT